MLHFAKFRQDLFDPTPAKEVYVKRPAGRGWPEQCPPIRSANAFGFDLLANFDVTFHNHGDAGWSAEPDTVLDSDFDWSADEHAEGRPLTQQYAWFWDRGQTLPHRIDDHVWQAIKHQVKVSTFLYLSTDENESLIVTDIPNMTADRGFRAVMSLIEPDWYPASYPWHVVLELDPSQQRITLERGQPLARLLPVRRDTYLAKPMSPNEFDDFFTRSQQWLARHGKFEHEGSAGGSHDGHADITGTYVKQQLRSRFVTLEM